MSSTTSEPDCTLCGTPKNQHSGRRHIFQGPDDDGQLQAPPKKRPEPLQNVQPATADAMMLRLIRTLVRKKVLDGDDLAAILGVGLVPGSEGTSRADSSSGQTASSS